jgi:hypothetical protein
MNTISRKRDAVAEWHWGVLALVCGVFFVLAAAAALRESWFAVAIALIGLGAFGKSAWRKYQSWRTGSWPAAVPPDEARANSMNARVVVLVGALGLLHPLYFLVSSGRFTPEDIAKLWPAFLMLWLVGVFIAGVVVFLFRYVAHHVARGIRDGRGDYV